MITVRHLRPFTSDLVSPSPNHGARRAPVIRGIVLHATADEGDEELSLAWLQSPKSRASCHLFVGRSGRTIRLVGDQQRAWHAGSAEWRGTRDVNSITLGIEIANRNDGEPFTDAQYARVAAIVAHYCRQGLALVDVVGHADIAAGRKTDPLGWDWERFRAMVLDQLTIDDDGRRWLAYDRRSGERIAADEAAAQHQGPDAAPPAPPSASAAARAEPDAPFVERRRVPRGRTRVPPPRVPPRARAPHAPKPVLRSRTIWLNALTVLAAGGVLVGDVLDLAYQVGLTLPEEITMWALFGVGLVNILLRFQTSRPIARGADVDVWTPEVPAIVPARVPTSGLGGAAAGQW